MVAIEINGEIKTFNSVPKTWKDNEGKNISPFHLQSAEVHNSYGIYQVVLPSLTDTQKIGEIYFDEENDVFTYYKVDKTPEELAIEAEQQLNSDVSQQAIDKRREDGQLGYDRIVAIIERKYRNGEITANQAKGALQFFDTLIEALNRGQWIIVQIKMNAATVPAGYQELFTTIKNKVDSYIQTSY